MIHYSVGLSRKVVKVVAALGAPLLAILAAGLSNPASAGGGGSLGDQPQIRGSYCDGSDDGLAPSRAGCARIKGYIAAGERFGSNDRIGGFPSPFAPINEPGIADSRSSSGFMIIGAPSSGDRFLPPTSPSDIAR
jgi:hypothetical protein